MLSPFLDQLPPWTDVLSKKHILFDTDAVISILEYKAQALLDKLQSIGSVFCIINPVYVELLRTENPAKRIERQALLSDYGFQVLPLTIKEFDAAKQIQAYLLSLKSYSASPTDLYLGARLSTISSGNIYLITSNLTDFPYPLYNRETGILLQGNKNTKVLSLLAFDPTELAKVNLS